PSLAGSQLRLLTAQGQLAAGLAGLLALGLRLALGLLGALAQALGLLARGLAGLLLEALGLLACLLGLVRQAVCLALGRGAVDRVGLRVAGGVVLGCVRRSE